MQCEACGKNEANVHLTHVVNDVSREVNLCEGCAGKNGININGAMSLTDILVGLGAIAETEDSDNGKVCSFCKLTLGDLRKGARMGCAVCYEVFGTELKAMLADMQNGTKHVGKVPGTNTTEVASVRMETLGRELEDAVAREDFEAAARIRDEIKTGRSVIAAEKMI